MRHAIICFALLSMLINGIFTARADTFGGGANRFEIESAPATTAISAIFAASGRDQLEIDLFPLPRSLHARDQRGSWNPQGVAQLEKGFERWRHPIVFQAAEESTVDVGLKRQLLLGHAGFEPGLFKDIAEHAKQFSGLAA